jgi:PAS domain S-box-containing protein
MVSASAATYLKKAFDAFDRSIIVISPEFTILAAAGRRVEKLETNLVGKRCHREIAAESTPCNHCAAVEVMSTGKPVLRTHGVEDLHRNQIACKFAYPIFDGDRIEAVVSMDFDVPLFEGLEEDLQRKNALLSNLLLSAADAIIAADREGKVFIFNQAASEVLGYDVDEALRNLDIRNIYPPGVAHDIMRKMRSRESGGRGKLKGYSVDCIGKDGEHIPVNLYASIIYAGEREVATIGIFRDLRNNLKMQKELQRTQMQLLQSDKMASLGKLAAGVAHQLNNPLGGITLFTKLLLEESDLSETVRGDLDRILNNAQRCRDTVKELLEFARQSRFEMRPQDVNKAIGRTLFLIENHSIFQNVQIEKILDPGLPQVQVDIQQFNHLLMNLIFNAAQAMEGNGKLTLTSAFVPKTGRIRLSISDTGSGIPEDVLPQIFEPFFTTKEQGQGTGLGLSLAYSIVKNHGGTIDVETAPGEGTTFTLELPLTHQDAKGEQDAGKPE